MTDRTLTSELLDDKQSTSSGTDKTQPSRLLHDRKSTGSGTDKTQPSRLLDDRKSTRTRTRTDKHQLSGPERKMQTGRGSEKDAEELGRILTSREVEKGADEQRSREQCLRAVKETDDQRRRGG